jgi:predicted nucleic acid-binding protein
MIVFVDTSALYAILDADDENHELAGQTWTDLIAQGADLTCTNYILLEGFALVQRRLGLGAIRTFQEDIIPMLRIEWVTDARHASGVAALLVAANRHLSLVDCVSFETMRRLGVRTVFAFDYHFVDQGFTLIPPDR